MTKHQPTPEERDERVKVDLPADKMMTFAQVKDVLGLSDVLDLRARLSGEP